MIPIERLEPQSVDVKVVLQGGKKINLTLRPYTMADHSWFQRNFSNEQDAHALAQAQLDPIARIAWQMLDGASRAQFNNIRYIEVSDDGTETTVDAEGYKKLLHALHGEESFWALLDAFIKCKGLNGFVSEESEVGLKKKGRLRKKTKSIGGLFSRLLPRNMVTRRHKSMS